MNEQQIFEEFLDEMCRKYSEFEDLSAAEFNRLAAYFLVLDDNAECAIVEMDEDRLSKVCKLLCRAVAVTDLDSQITRDANRSLANAIVGGCVDHCHEHLAELFEIKQLETENYNDDWKSENLTLRKGIPSMRKGIPSIFDDIEGHVTKITEDYIRFKKLTGEIK